MVFGVIVYEVSVFPSLGPLFHVYFGQFWVILSVLVVLVNLMIVEVIWMVMYFFYCMRSIFSPQTANGTLCGRPFPFCRHFPVNNEL